MASTYNRKTSSQYFDSVEQVQERRTHTRRCLATSAGGRYGGSGDFSLNAEARTEKYKITFPTISRRGTLVGLMKSRRTVCAVCTISINGGSRWKQSTLKVTHCVPVEQTMSLVFVIG